MDVGNPSNFPRMLELLGGNYEQVVSHVTGFHYDDEAIMDTISEVYDRFDYFLCPHTAIGYRAVKQYLTSNPGKVGIMLSTAHPAKFMDTVDKATGSDVEVPLVLEEVMGKAKESILIGNKYADLKAILMN